MTSLKKKKILVIEDEKPMLRALELKLGHAGFDVTSATNGEDGLKAVESGIFDLIVCDLVMPKVNGFCFLEEMKTKKKSVPIVVLTNLSQSEDENKAKSLGALAFLVKANTSIAQVVAHCKRFV